MRLTTKELNERIRQRKAAAADFRKCPTCGDWIDTRFGNATRHIIKCAQPRNHH